MGSGLRKAIAEERWVDVRSMLIDENVQNRINKKFYKYTPNKGSKKNNNGLTESVQALHLIALREAPIDIIEKILLVAPESINTKSVPRQEVPLHYAARSSKSTAQTIQILALASPAACAVQSHPQQQTPLHIACENKRSIEILKILANVSGPQVLTLKDAYGRTPWDIILHNTTAWNFFYRRSARFLIPHKNDTNDNNDNENNDNGNVTDDKKSIEILDEKNSQKNHEDNTDETTDACVVCWDGTPTHSLVPCGHLCLCNECGRYNASRLAYRKCPICNDMFKSCIRIYQSGVDTKS